MDVRFDVLRVGYRLGWASVAVVLVAVAIDAHVHHRWLLVACTLAAGAVNSAATFVPWRDWLAARRGQLLLDLWCAGLIAFVSLLVADGGPSFSLLLFLTVPFIAVAQTGRRRVFWLAVVGADCAVDAALAPAMADATVLRLVLLAALSGVAIVVVRTMRIERALAREADHRITNDLQAAADLLLLGGPEQTAQRIRAIAALHRLLARDARRVDARELLQAIASTAPLPVNVRAATVSFDPETARILGAVANELVTNACRHGAPPVSVDLRAGALVVEDGGLGISAPPGVGLALVRRLVEDGLHGSLQLRGSRAEVSFPR
jgi:two-component sensor histidine kinase